MVDGLQGGGELEWVYSCGVRSSGETHMNSIVVGFEVYVYNYQQQIAQIHIL